MKIKMNLEPVLRCLPQNVAAAAAKYEVEEIRILADKPVIIYISGEGFFVNNMGDITSVQNNGVIITKSMLNEIFRIICDNSIYAVEDEIRCGYITIQGGHRVGICGTAVIKSGQISTIKNISALNIRVAKQAIGTAKEIIPIVMDKIVRNTLIVSPPGCGKTTMLRDIARILGFTYRVGIADERSEIAAVYQGIPQNDIGVRSVVMDACPKDVAINMLIRSMGVEVILTDEIGSMADVEAIKSALNAGVKIIASAHGYSHKDIIKKPYIKDLIGEYGFEKVITLSRKYGVGTVEEVVEFDI